MTLDYDKAFGAGSGRRQRQRCGDAVFFQKMRRCHTEGAVINQKQRRHTSGAATSENCSGAASFELLGAVLSSTTKNSRPDFFWATVKVDSIYDSLSQIKS